MPSCPPLARAPDPVAGTPLPPVPAGQTELLDALAAVTGHAAALEAQLAREREARERAEALACDLGRRRRLFEDLSEIQRSISHRAPLPEVLDGIVAAAEHLFGDEMPAILLAEEDDPTTLRLASSRGLSRAYRQTLARRGAGDGAAGRAYSEGRLIVIEDYADSPDGMSLFRDKGVTAAMAAPVHEHGRVIGSLIVSTHRPGRRYSATERDILMSLAQHASLAVSDAKTVAAVAHRAMHDGLTGLPNNALFRDRLEHATARAARHGTKVAVLFCDLDRFKSVNDTHGHAAGDELLVEVARRLRASVRATDTAARVGGDEFAVLLEDLGGDDEAEVVAARIVEALAAPVTVAGAEARTGASVGIAVGSDDPIALLRAADAAMYRVKCAGGGAAMPYDAAMGEEDVLRLALENDLAGAVERGELEIDYQPIVELAGGAITGFEALLRWAHPERGRLAPGTFIPIAEERGLIREIGRHTLRAACAQAAAWRRAHPGAGLDTVAVNLSALELADPGLSADVAAALQDAGLPAHCLVLEITETALMRDTETTTARLRALKALGVRLAVDDFGTGYSSLRYLRRFPVDILKMARPFVEVVAADELETALACAIVDLGANLGLRIVAEGIEREEQAAVLEALGCQLGQGYHYARPLPPAAVSAALADAAGDGGWALRDDVAVAAA